MIRRPPRSTRTDTLFPYTTLFRSSVLSKKIAAGSTHVVIDIPVGPTAKVRSKESARHLAERMRAVAARSGLEARCLLTDGTQPVGRGVGPRSEEHTSELQSLMRISYAVFCLKKKTATSPAPQP